MNVIFFHLPKTAGTTLQELIRKNYRSGDIFQYRGHVLLETEDILQKSRDYKFTLGHFRYRPELLSEGNYLFTFLREPLDRCVSNFLHFRRSGRYGNGDIMTQMENFLYGDELLSNGNYNLQSQFMAGLCKQQDFMDREDEHLQKAIANLKQLNFTGISEKFEKSIHMLGRELTWKKRYYISHNRSGNLALKKKITANFHSRLQEINRLDAELYREGLEIFRAQQKQIKISSLEIVKARGLSTLKALKRKF